MYTPKVCVAMSPISVVPERNQVTDELIQPVISIFKMQENLLTRFPVDLVSQRNFVVNNSGFVGLFRRPERRFLHNQQR